MPSIHDLNVASELPLVQGFEEVLPDALAELATLVVQRRVATGDLATEQGQVPLGLCLLVRGAAKTVRTLGASRGRVERVLDVMRASCIVADASVFDGLPSDASVVALRSSHLFVLERRALLKLMTSHPSLDRALFGRFVHESRSHARRVDELACGPVEERVLRLLEGLSAQHGTPLGHGRFVALPLRRRDLASMVNSTTETVSRLLAKLEREGKVRSTRNGIWWRGVVRRAPAAAPEPAP
jgi:CRP/FNR family transcriptional regulator